jgi:tetratricopeptide (TPR) repeat protein
MLEGRRGPGVAERLGRHLVGAGRVQAALAPLAAGARERLAAGDAGGAEALSAEHLAALDALGVPAEDVRRATTELIAADLALFRGRPAEALPRAHSAATLAAAAGDRAACAAALFARGTASRRLGDLPGAERAFGAAMEVAAEAGDPRRSAMARAARAWIIGARGDLAEAARELRRTRAALLALGDEEASASCALHLGSIAARTGRLRAARTWIENARRCFEKIGDRERAAIATSDLAEVARTAGDLEAAEPGTREALARLRALGAGSAPVAAANLALILVLRGRAEEARAIAEPLVAELERAGRLLLLPFVEACLLACAAVSRDGHAWEHHMARVEARAADAGYADPDLAVALRQAAQAARANGWSARAARALAAAA